MPEPEPLPEFEDIWYEFIDDFHRRVTFDQLLENSKQRGYIYVYRILDEDLKEDEPEEEFKEPEQIVETHPEEIVQVKSKKPKRKSEYKVQEESPWVLK